MRAGETKRESGVQSAPAGMRTGAVNLGKGPAARRDSTPPPRRVAGWGRQRWPAALLFLTWLVPASVPEAPAREKSGLRRNGGRRDVRPLHPRVGKASQVLVAQADRPHGEVVFAVTPAGSRVFVDGCYIGLAGDFGGRPERARLAPGSHRVAALSPEGIEELRRLVIEEGREIEFRHDF